MDAGNLTGKIAQLAGCCWPETRNVLSAALVIPLGPHTRRRRPPLVEL